MRILMINHFPLEGSGSGTYTKNLAMQLVENGHEVCVIMPENRSDYPRYEGVQFHPVFFTNTMPVHAQTEDIDTAPPAGALPFNFPCFTTHPHSVTSFADLSSDQIDAYLEAFRNALAQEVAQFKPDIIHGQHIWMLPALAADYNIPLVLTAHGTDLMGCSEWPDLRHYAETAMDACARVLCVSRDNEALVRTVFPAHTHKVIRMRNGYNPAIFFAQDLDAPSVLQPYGINPAGKRIVLFAGKLTAFKGVNVLLDAAALYQDKLEDVITLIAGDGELRADLHEQAEKLHLHSLHFLGNVSQEELCRLYNIACVDIVPSRREPFGLVAVEAMACGTPVIATNEGGLPDFVNDEVGALVPVDDAQALADAIVAVLERASNDTEWSSRIRDYASSYSQAEIISALEDVYRSVIQESDARG